MRIRAAGHHSKPSDLIIGASAGTATTFAILRSGAFPFCDKYLGMCEQTGRWRQHAYEHFLITQAKQLLAVPVGQ